jgi:hypothetical protein
MANVNKQARSGGQSNNNPSINHTRNRGNRDYRNTDESHTYG